MRWIVPIPVPNLLIAYLHRNYDNYVKVNIVTEQNRTEQDNIIELASFEVS